MSTRALNAYATMQRETSVASARPIDLVVLVYRRLIDHLRHGRQQLLIQEDASAALSKALDLLNSGLDACLDRKEGGEIAENLAAIYTWANREILMARLKNDAPRLSLVIDVFCTVSQAWEQHATSNLTNASNPLQSLSDLAQGIAQTGQPLLKPAMA